VGTLGLVSDVSATAAGDQLLLIDGNSLAYRAFFALPESITTTAGFPTNALYGLAAMMVKVLGDETPGRVIVAWDPPGKVFRHDQYPEYKAGRRETPDLLREQTRWFRPLMEAFGFRNTEIAGFEADDVIGTLARRASEAGQTVTILTGDRDALQLVDERVSVLATGRGVTDTTLYTPERVEERYGVGPALMTDFRGLVGDSSDNLPGVPGIGEKGAATLLNRYGTLDEVLANAQEQTPKRRESLIEHAEDARMSRDLAVIDRNVPLELDPTDDADAPPFALDATRLAELNRVFDEFEFTSLKRRLEEITAERPEAAPDQLTISIAATQTPGSDLDSDLADGPVALAISDGVAAVADAAGAVLTVELDENGGAALVAALASRDVACHDVKGLPNDLREAILDRCHDTMIAAYLLEPRRRGQYQLEDLLEAAGIGFDEEADEPGAVRQAAGVRELSARQAPAIEAEGLGSLMRDVEIPVAAVLANMEQLGITLDVARLGEIAARVRDNADELRDQIWDLAGGEFVIESPKQLGQVLFERLELPTYRRGKTGWSTDRQVLKLLEDKHPIVPLIGRYRELTKLDSTYLSALPELIDPSDGRLHTTFNQTVAETGRLHRATAAEVFGMAPGDVDKTTRDRAKAVNFGIVYGISDFGLGEQLGIPRADAGRYIEAYLQRYPRVQSFIDTTIANATQEGLVTTVFGRRRPIPELSGRTVQQRQRGERLAVNTVIQGSAADIMKAAMVQAEADLNGSGLAARLVLQIHDELLIEAPKGEAGRAGEIVRRAMVGAFDLDPPLVVDVGSGETWLEAK
jgi:DNA polymerase-1